MLRFLHYVTPGIPDRPQSIHLKDEDPTMIILTVTPPSYTGGMPIIGYRVEYESRIQDFQLGKASLTSWAFSVLFGKVKFAAIFTEQYTRVQSSLAKGLLLLCDSVLNLTHLENCCASGFKHLASYIIGINLMENCVLFYIIKLTLPAKDQS